MLCEVECEMIPENIQNRAKTLHARFLGYAELIASEAGLPNAGPALTGYFHSRMLGAPWPEVDFELAKAAKKMRELAERPLVLATRLFAV